MKTYAFLENQTWKKQLQQSAALRLLKHNEIIYSRINKVETTESRILSEQKEHIRNISIGTTHMGRLKAIARQRDVDRIQRENAHIKERLSKVKPFYSKKQFDDSFKHHETFVRGRCEEASLLPLPYVLMSLCLCICMCVYMHWSSALCVVPQADG